MCTVQHFVPKTVVVIVVIYHFHAADLFISMHNANHMLRGYLFCKFGVITTKGKKTDYPHCVSNADILNSPQKVLKISSDFYKRLSNSLQLALNFPSIGRICCRWLSVRLETLGALAAFSAAVLAIEARGAASQMGLTLSYALQITSLTSMTVRLASVAENAFNAVERMAEYSKLKEEAPAVIPNSAPSDWPSAGKVSWKYGMPSNLGFVEGLEYSKLKEEAPAVIPNSAPSGWPSAGKVSWKYGTPSMFFGFL